MWSDLNKSEIGIRGGFLNDSQNSNKESRENVKRVQNVIPVMIRHLLESGDRVQIWGTTLNLFTFIGIVRLMNKSTTKKTYEIEDETGKIMAYCWLEATGMTENLSIKLNTYVRIYGHLREQNEKKHVLVLKMFPVKDFTEIISHLLEVVHVILKFQREGNIKDHTSNMANNDVSMDIDKYNKILTKDQDVVFKIIEAENSTVNGIERSIIKARAPHSISYLVNDIIDSLINEGHIYTTITEDYFKTT